VRATISNTVAQGVGIVTGLQNGFDWRSVAMAGISAAVGKGVAGDAKGARTFAQSFESSMAGATAAAIASGGRISLTQIAVDAFGNALGNSIADGLKQSAPAADDASSPSSGSKAISSLAIKRAMNGGLSGSDVFGGEKDWLAAIGPYAGAGPTVAEDDARLYIHPVVPEVEVTGQLTDQQRIWKALGGRTAFDILPPDEMAGASATTNYVQRFGNGVVSAIKGVTVEPILQVRDMALAGASVAYNEMFRSKGSPMWFPEMKSGIAGAYASGASQTKLVLGSVPLLSVGVTAYDGITALKEGRYGDAVELAGGVAGGFAIGKTTQKFGGYGLALDDIGGPNYGPLAYQRGAVGLKLVRPNDIALGAVRNANGGVDFVDSPYLYPVSEGQKNIVTIEYTGSRRQDFGAANREAELGTTQKPPEGYTWHHLDDYNPATNTGTMQLIETGAHEATYPHNGGVKQYQDTTGRKYK
jgi:hypothetical protein